MKFQIIRLLFLITLLTPIQLFALECPHCGAKGLSELVFICPDCGKEVHKLEFRGIKRSSTFLEIDIGYTGRRIKRLPPYGKVYVNGKYIGNIPLIDSGLRNPDPALRFTKDRSLGVSGRYKRSWHTLPDGQVKVQVKLRFSRMFGVARSERTLTFPYVNLRSGKKTFLSHRFSSLRSFSKRTAEPLPRPPKQLPVKFIAGSGTARLEAGIFK